MNDEHKVLDAIAENPGLRTSQLVELLDLPRDRVEDAIWELWRNGKIQTEADSTLRVTRDGEVPFRHIL